MILKVGLTGGIATGKSTVGRRLADLGAIVIDADRVVDELYRPGQAGHRVLIEHYGESILSPAGEIDRPSLSRAALSTAAGSEKLNRLIHPLVIAEEERRIAELESAAGNGVVVVEATLLLESGGRGRYDLVVVVDTDPETQVLRAVTRGLPEQEARLRISRQMPREERLLAADYVVDSSGSHEDTLRRTDEIWAKLSDDLDARAQ